MTASDKICKAKVELYIYCPFFAVLTFKAEYLEDKSIPTTATNGKVIRYNPDYIDSITLDQTIGVLCANVMSHALYHNTRRKGRDPIKWSYACGYATHPIILETKRKGNKNMELPDGALVHKDFENMAADEIFNKLPDPPVGFVPMVQVNDSQARTQSEVDQIEAEMRQDLAQAAVMAKQAGKLPAHLERLIEELLAPKIPWKEVLQRFLCQVVQNDYTWAKPNKRYIHMNLYLPALESSETGEIVLVVDTSGSIGTEELNQVAAEIQEIAATFKIGFKIIYVDADVAGVQEVEPDEDLVLKPQGGGGTHFSPAFIWLEEQGIEPCALVYFTDGYCDDFPQAPHYPTLWIIDNAYKGKSFLPPFGEVLHIE